MGDNRVHRCVAKLIRFSFVYNCVAFLLTPAMEGERQFYLYILSLSTVLCIVSLIFELCWNGNGKTLDGPYNKISYTKSQLLNLKLRAHTMRISTEICKHITNLHIKRSFRRKIGGKRLRQRTWDQNRGIHQNLLWPMEQSDNLWTYGTCEHTVSQTKTGHADTSYVGK